MQTSQKVMEDFFQEYRGAINALDINKIARFFHVPGMICNNNNVYLLTSQEVLLKSLGDLIAKQKTLEPHHSDFVIMTTVDVDSERILASLEWTISDSKDMPIRKFRSTYNLIKSDDQWKIVLLME